MEKSEKEWKRVKKRVYSISSISYLICTLGTGRASPSSIAMDCLMATIIAFLMWPTEAVSCIKKKQPKQKTTKTKTTKTRTKRFLESEPAKQLVLSQHHNNTTTTPQQHHHQ
jgi:hypothetical protein